jgi:hypothetical protein
MPHDGVAVLYTSLEREGALAEISYRLGLLTPVPTKPIALHTLRVRARKAIRITRNEFAALGIDAARFGDLDYRRTQVVGDAVGFLEFDGMLVPSARWDCENLVLLQDHLDISDAPTRIHTEELSWIDWAKEHGFVASERPNT